MRLPKNQSGFSAVEAVLVILFAGLLVFVGYAFYNSQLSPEATSTTPQSGSNSTDDDVPAAPEINSESDLDNANGTLDQIDVEESNNGDNSELDSETSGY